MRPGGRESNVPGAMGKLPNNWVQYLPDWRLAPMAYWVHVEPEGEDWRQASRYDPPAPVPERDKGFPILCIESQGFLFTFSSAAQLDEAIRVLSQVPLPTTRQLSARRRGGHGPNSHWLSRLPGAIKSPKARRRAVDDLSAVWRGMAGKDLLRPTPLRGATGPGR